MFPLDRWKAFEKKLTPYKISKIYSPRNSLEVNRSYQQWRQPFSGRRGNSSRKKSFETVFLLRFGVLAFDFCLNLKLPLIAIRGVKAH